MNKSIILFAAAAFLCAGCDKLPKSEAAQKKQAAAEDAAAKAQAKFAARLAAKGETRSATVAAAGSEAVAAAGGEVIAAGDPGNAGAALVGMLCSSPKLMGNIESDLDLLEALSGEGGDPDEVKRKFLEFRERYRTAVEKKLSARGATYEEFLSYALGQAAAPQKQKLKTLVEEKCPRGDKVLVEKTAGGLMYYLTTAIPE